MMGTHLWLWGPDGESPVFPDMIAGKAAALFAVLAGVGIALTTRRDLEARDSRSARLNLLGRGAALIVIGLALGTFSFFILVILAYYGVMFLLLIPFVRLRARWLLLAAVVWAIVWPLCSHAIRALLGTDGLPVSSPGLTDLFAPHLLVLDLLLTGTYPAIAWMVYGLVGMAIGKLIVERTRSIGAGRAVGGPAGQAGAGGHGATGRAGAAGHADAGQPDAVGHADAAGPVRASGAAGTAGHAGAARDTHPERRPLAWLGAWLVVWGAGVACVILLVNELLVRFVALPAIASGSEGVGVIGSGSSGEGSGSDDGGAWAGSGGNGSDAQAEVLEQLRESAHGTMPTDSLWNLLATGPHTTTPFDLIITAAVAAAVIGACLAIAEFFGRTARRVLLPVLGAGAAPLTVYTVHVIVTTVAWAAVSAIGEAPESTWWVSGWPLWIVHIVVALIIGALLGLVGERGPLERVVSSSGRAVAWMGAESRSKSDA